MTLESIQIVIFFTTLSSLGYFPAFEYTVHSKPHIRVTVSFNEERETIEWHYLCHVLIESPQLITTQGTNNKMLCNVIKSFNISKLSSKFENADEFQGFDAQFSFKGKR